METALALLVAFVVWTIKQIQEIPVWLWAVIWIGWEIERIKTLIRENKK
ncbi:hypothetical protein KXY27_004557 [Salmonella enterica]|nr:hypothetical protein [Salmonella enterica]EHU5767755.1 hypothetical protein [Salmonella enterica]